MILLVSGGLDSFIASKYLEKHNNYPKHLYIDYRGKYTTKELAVCQDLYQNLQVDSSLDFRGMERGTKSFIKNRNAHFALVGSNYDKIIVMAGLLDDNVGDKSQEAFKKMGDLLSEINTGEYQVISPFWRKTKSDIIKWYLDNDFPITDLLDTTSCYDPTELFCGKCPSCFRKWCAFNDNDISSHLPDFKNLPLVKKYTLTLSRYTKERQESILKAAADLGVH